MVMPKTRASAGAAGGAFGALEVMMASIHHAAILEASPHQTFLDYWESTAVIVLGSCNCSISERAGTRVLWQTGQAVQGMLKPEYGAARFGGDADSTREAVLGSPRANM